MDSWPAIRRIVRYCPRTANALLLSDMEASVARLVNNYMRNPVRSPLDSTLKPSEMVRVQAFEVAADRKHRCSNRLLSKEPGRCLVFARTKRGTERIARELGREGFTVAMIHGDRSQSQRIAALAGFQQGRYRVLVAPISRRAESTWKISRM